MNQKRSILPVVTALAFLLTASTHFAKAQNLYAAIHGTVTDTSGAVIPNATVTVVNTSTGITTAKQTNSEGYYIFPQLQSGGPYTVTISSQAFQNFVSSGLNLDVNDNRDIDAKLLPGSTSQTVQVNATALQVETSDTQLKQVVTASQLEQIPMEGRDPAGLQKLEPGVVESSDRLGNFSSNGSQTPQNAYLVNGIDITDVSLNQEGLQVNPDALQEEDIVTSTINPESSRNSGAIINQVVKPGSNRFHGSGFEFYRDTFLNNGNYFSQIRPDFHQNLYGGTLGGPLLRNKLFFFTAYQGLRNRTGETQVPQTMSSDQLAGMFSGNLNYSVGGNDNTPYTASNGQHFNDGLANNPLPFPVTGPMGTCAPPETWAECFNGPGSSGTAVNIASGQWNSLAAKIVQQYVPGSNFQSGGNSYYDFNAANTLAQDQGIARIDYTPTSRDTIWTSTIFQSSPGTNALPFGGSSFPGFTMVAADHYKLFNASWTHTFGADMLNELRAGYYRNNYPSVIPQTVTQPGSYGFSISPQLAQASLPYMSIGAYFNLGFSYEGPQPRVDTSLTYSDNFSWIIGNHSLKFGGSFEQFRVRNPFAYLNNGSYSYNGSGQYSSGDPMIDFVMGIPDSYAQTSDGFINAVSSERYVYLQDNWKVSPTFTVNLGIAWDAEQPTQNAQFGGLGINCWANTSVTSKIFPGGPPGLFFPGDPGCNAAGSPTTNYKHFGPRVGFAWSPESGPARLIGTPGSHEFSVRGGFGIYYNRDQEEQSLQNLEDPPFFYYSRGAGDVGGSPAFINPFQDVSGNTSLSEANPFPFTVPTAGAMIDWTQYNQLALATFDKHYDAPYIYNFNLNVQRSLPANMVMQIGYVGSLGRRLPSWYEGDPITPAGHAACAAGATVPGFPASDTCNGNLRTAIHTYFPQFAAQPAIVPGSQSQLPNGLPWYTSIAAQNTEGSSSYHSFQASLIKAPTHGLQFTLAYTYSHALDDGSGYESVTGGDSGYGPGRALIWVPQFKWLNYGDSDYDARHRIVASYVYQVPVAGFMKHNLLLREALSGWGIGGVTAAQTGFPVGISMGTSQSLWCDASYFGCGDVPDTSSTHIATYNPRNSGHQWFDITPFSAEPLGTYGNTRRNFFHGPGFNYTNLQISKTFNVSPDGVRSVQLRLEAFNAFNHANFAAPSGNFSDSSFGLITNVIQSAEVNQDPQPGRAIQLVGKFYF
ncbi:TonB-dependent receptor [Paracidobacterium acidisoli]|uniref:Carboxypeptidase regulatory-like domain-containing protein n=1 Tax=Paracidobacterium acidisoli TaxID=2303751 RepID=A0A372IN90_9BACT|nr:carboxypeptidase-like regulatory domain-containing protein [Paracidobacterium acidisoli]MBT9331856.1 carboxypeptidase-like regulatory domain-containing protein [Paracidobacterium acidisoli]